MGALRRLNDRLKTLDRRVIGEGGWSLLSWRIRVFIGIAITLKVSSDMSSSSVAAAVLEIAAAVGYWIWFGYTIKRRKA